MSEERDRIGERGGDARGSRVNCVVGLGYVGLTVAVALDRAGYPTVGYDIDTEKIRELNAGRDPTGEFGDDAIAASDISFTDSPTDIERAKYVHVALPTPIDETARPDLSGLEVASETIGRHLADDAVVVYESTLYPGATRERLRPALERGATAGNGATFRVGYSPERIVPGTARTTTNVTKVVGAEDDETRAELEVLFDDMVGGDVYPVESIEIAEAAKCIENVQRDVNIALMNEFAQGCRELDFDLDPHAVLDAAGTKWNFHRYEPGLVGGHCIPVDPHYLRHKFEQSGYVPQLIRSARTVNQGMSGYVCSLVVDALETARAETRLVESSGIAEGSGTASAASEAPFGARALLLGFTYKPNVGDVRNSAVQDVAEGLSRRGIEVVGHDPHFDAETVPETFDFEVQSSVDFDDVDCAVVLAAHDEIRDYDLERMADEMADDPVLVDVGNGFDPDEATAHGFTYRRL
ncbi:nucleotide sugar dehydrogenase [Halorussus amylolyticus]|uniref:nucleotide sugar dehydrogenase n=1 Tax=Halorussus amylolyticus TaxID=1126242 RepID=UPI001050B912|nr:nucleotide sugar dehydrogenase [Halorussus amylolyticus]